MENLKLLREKDYKLFKSIFSVFMRDPFFEKWTNAEMLEEFKDFLAYGKMFCYDNKGLMNIVPNRKKLETLPYDMWGNFLYLSDIAVLENARMQGIGSTMFDYLIEYGYENEFDVIYFRTNLEKSKSAGIGLKKGFTVVTDCNNNIITEAVSFPRVREDISETDIRQYLVKKLK